MVTKVTNMVLNANNTVRLARQAMKDRNMFVVKNFTPVISEHVVQVNPTKRLRFKLTDNEFTYTEEKRIRNNWQESITYNYTNTRENVENQFIKFISYISGKKS